MFFTQTWLFFIFVVSTRNFTQAFGDSIHKGWMEHDAPTCEQLRSLWDIISRTVRLSQITNEIPIIPVEIFAVLDQHQRYGGGRRGAGRSMEGISHSKNIPDLFLGDALKSSSDLREAILPLSPSDPSLFHAPTFTKNQEVNGVFGDFHPQDSDHWREASQLLGSGSKKIGDDSDMFIPHWGAPEEIGSFGQFVDVEDGFPEAAMIRTPKGPVGEWTVATQPEVVPYGSIQIPCIDVINKKCKGSEQCVCGGLTILQCVHGRCSNKELINGNTNQYGAWHEEALPRSHLGIFRRLRKRSNKSIFM